MKKKRLIPVLLLQNGWLVQSKGFERYQNLGNPITAVKRLSEWGSDELIYLNISKDEVYDIRRDDQGYPNRHSFYDIIKDVAKLTFMPITVGGKVKTLKDVEDLILIGADKVSINSQPLQDKNFITQSAQEFGSQCIVVSMDVKIIDNQYRVFSDGGRKKTRFHPVEWAKIAEEQGAGEILLNSIDRDGAATGYDIELLQMVCDKVKIPVIACGGVGQWQDFGEALAKTKVDAVAAANIFHYTDQSVYLAKKYLFDNHHNVRPPDLLMVSA